MADNIPPILQSPKQQLMSDAKRISRHRDLVASDQMLDSTATAMLEYQRMLSLSTADSNAAAANMFKLKGAQEFLIVLVNLSEAQKQPEPSRIQRLDHSV